MELKHTNIDERAEKYVNGLIEFRRRNGEPSEKFSKHDMVTCFCYAHQDLNELVAGELGTFGQAIETLKSGFRVTRAGWNGKGMFLWLKRGATIKAEWCKDTRLREIIENNGGEMDGLPTICMKTADNKILTGWLASQTDMLANDWYVIDRE